MLDNKILRKNIALMLSHKEGGMVYLATHESSGGNAGAKRVGLNFRFYFSTGEILFFDNWSTSSQIQEGVGEGSFQGILDLDYQKVINRIPLDPMQVSIYSLPKRTSKEARLTLDVCVRVFNELQKKSEEKEKFLLLAKKLQQRF